MCVVKKLLMIITMIFLMNDCNGNPLTIIEKNVSNRFNYTEIVDLIQSRLNENVDPCDDFYEFACGKYLMDAEIADDSDNTGIIGEIEEITRYQLNEVLNSSITDTDIGPFKLAKVFYQKCLDEDLIERLASTPLKRTLGDFRWPLMENNEVTYATPDWTEVIKYGNDRGLLSYSILSVYVDADLSDSSRYILYIDQLESYLPQEIYLDGIEDPVMVAYNKLIETVMQLLDDQILPEDTNRIAQEIIQLEISLAKIADKREDRRDFTSLNHHMSVSELQSNFTYLNWLEFINYLLPKGHKVNHTEVVLVSDLSYLSKLDALLKRTPMRVLYNYVLWTIIADTLSLLNKDFRNAVARFDNAVYGTSEESLRWDECSGLALHLMPDIVGAMYVREFFTNESRIAVTQMLKNIVEEFKIILKNVTWMDGVTMKTALHKIESMQYFVGHADELSNDTLLETYYKGMYVSNSNLSFFDLVLNISKFSTDEVFRLLQEKKVKRNDWRFLQTPATVNAFYLASHNHIELSAAILQNEVFSLNRPQFLNYASLGHVIGHEITHALDDMGRQFDSYGNLKNWWQKETLREYIKKSRCFVEQYSNYTINGKHVDGVNSQGENIADNGGFKVSYRTYKKYIKNENEVKALNEAGSNYTRDQLFWIVSAQTWCTKRREESIRVMLETADHPLEKFRIIGSFSNNQDFIKDFKCKSGTRMNPNRKCEIW